MRKAFFKSIISLLLGILSIIYAQVAYVIANLLYQNHLLYFCGLSFGLILSILGLYFSRAGFKGNNQNAQKLVYAKAGRICSIIGVCFNLITVIPILWFSILGIFGP